MPHAISLPLLQDMAIPCSQGITIRAERYFLYVYTLNVISCRDSQGDRVLHLLASLAIRYLNNLLRLALQVIL